LAIHAPALWVGLNSLAAGEGLQIQSEAASTVSSTGAFVFML